MVVVNCILPVAAVCVRAQADFCTHSAQRCPREYVCYPQAARSSLPNLMIARLPSVGVARCQVVVAVLVPVYKMRRGGVRRSRVRVLRLSLLSWISSGDLPRVCWGRIS